MSFKKLTNVNFSEIYKRVPQNQMKQFMQFRDKNAEYKRRVHKYPEQLPLIDWDYYRTNVRAESVKMVDEFEQKYKELNRTFDNRDQVDTKKYYEELQKMKCEVRDEIDAFIAGSNKRIKEYESEIERIRAMLPYEEMSLEEFWIACPEKVPFSYDKPSFWPHTPEEQLSSLSAMPQKHEDGEEKEERTMVAAGETKLEPKTETQTPKSAAADPYTEMSTKNNESGGKKDPGKNNDTKS